MAAARPRRAFLPIGLLLLIFLFVWKCVPKPITDLQVLEVTRVPASALPVTDDLRETLSERSEAVWKVSLSGDAGWLREVKRHELNSYATVLRCDERDSSVLSLGPYVGQVKVTAYGFDERPPSANIVRYDVYLPERGHYKSEADFNASMPAYDLGKQRLLLCLRIAGGAMHGAYNRSNEVKVQIGDYL